MLEVVVSIIQEEICKIVRVEVARLIESELRRFESVIKTGIRKFVIKIEMVEVSQYDTPKQLPHPQSTRKMLGV